MVDARVGWNTLVRVFKNIRKKQCWISPTLTFYPTVGLILCFSTKTKYKTDRRVELYSGKNPAQECCKGHLDKQLSKDAVLNNRRRTDLKFNYTKVRSSDLNMWWHEFRSVGLISCYKNVQPT